MIDFQKFDLSKKEEYRRLLTANGELGCEYSLANLNLWGRQKAAFLNGFLVLFSQFERSSVYPFPVGKGDLKAVLDAVIADARERGIVCRLTGLSAENTMLLEELYPGKFRFYPDRDGCDYVYAIDDLAELTGRKFQKKRNHLNRFRQEHPNCQITPITPENLPAVQEMAAQWYAGRKDDRDYHLEQYALHRAFCHMEELDIECVMLTENHRVLAFAMGSPLSETTFDIHFEKAVEDVDGAYPAINQAFAAYLRNKYPQLQYLNREDDMGIPGLRKAKLSYCPDHLVVKFWANLLEDDDER